MHLCIRPLGVTALFEPGNRFARAADFTVTLSDPQDVPSATPGVESHGAVEIGMDRLVRSTIQTSAIAGSAEQAPLAD